MDDVLDELFGDNEETLSQDDQGQVAPEENDSDFGDDENDFEDTDSPETQDSVEPKEDSEEKKDLDKQEEPEKTDREKQLESDKELLEKRVNDNRASYQREHQAKLDLEKRVAELEAKQNEESDDDEDWLSDGTQDSKELEELRKQVEDLNQRDVERTQALAAEKWELASKPLREKHSDFDEYVDAVADAYDGNAELQAKFEEMGRTPEAAYKLGKQLEQQEMMKDPEKYKAYLLEELKKEQTGKQSDDQVFADGLADLAGNSTPPDNGNHNADIDVLDELFG